MTVIGVQGAAAGVQDLGKGGLERRQVQPGNGLECSPQVLVLYLRCNGELFKFLLLINYLFYKDYFASNVKGGLESVSQTFLMVRITCK